MKLFTCLAGLAALLLFSCMGKKAAVAEHPETGSELIPFQVIASGAYSGMQDSGTVIIQTPEVWAEYWKKIYSNTIPVPILPKIDFEKNSLIGCFMGTQTSGGYSISIDTIQKMGQSVDIVVLREKPGDNCIRTMALTQPFVVVSLPKLDPKRCQFSFLDNIQGC